MEEPVNSDSKTAKKVFTTVHRRKSSNEKGEGEEPMKNPSNSKVSKQLKDTIEEQVNKSVENTNSSSKKSIDEKKKRKRKKPLKNSNEKDAQKSVEKVAEKVEKINLNSSLNVEAVPFNPSSSSEAAPTKSKIESSKVVRRPVSRPSPKVKEAEDLRSVEVNQLKIRFSPTGFLMIKNASEDSVKMQCVLPITDPDFAFDLESVRLEIKLPRGYPGTKDAPIRPDFSILNSDLPATIVARIERNLKWGLGSLPGGVLVCRPMLRYLEDNLEKWLVDDVRESAFKFVKPAEIKVSPGLREKDVIDKCRSGEYEGESDVEEDKDKSCVNQAHNNTSNNNSVVNSNGRISKGDWIAPAPITDQSCVGGSPYTLKLIFSCIRGIDFLTSQRVTFLASCDRCRFAFPVEDLRPFVDRIEHCPKCTNQTKFHYKTQLITPGANFEVEDGDEFEGFLGTIRFLRAKPVDLLPSLYQCACNRCYGNEEDEDEDDYRRTDKAASSSSCKIEKVKIGEAIAYNCFRCHQKIRFQIDRIEWTADSTFSSSSGSSGSSGSSKQQVKSKSGPTLTVGTPLPLNGACEHYKKSFRWYRFPCCGQAFPCDECHAKDPIAKGHPVEWATRFICGFCSREQSISVKECPECGRDTSASARKHTTFWEGGKGIRNQILMSRKDSKKYKDYSGKSKSSGVSNQKK